MSTAVAAWERRGRRVGLAGESIFVVDQPARRAGGPPVLVLHGFPTCSFDWVFVLDALAARHRVVVPDMVGYGFSSKPDRPVAVASDPLHRGAARLRTAVDGRDRAAPGAAHGGVG